MVGTKAREMVGGGGGGGGESGNKREGGGTKERDGGREGEKARGREGGRERERETPCKGQVGSGCLECAAICLCFPSLFVPGDIARVVVVVVVVVVGFPCGCFLYRRGLECRLLRKRERHTHTVRTHNYTMSRVISRLIL